MESLGDVAPRVGAGANVAMAIDDKAIGARAAAAHVGCGVVLWLRAALARLAIPRYLYCKMLISDRPKWPIFAHS